jgi:hypothetical protein
MYVDACAEPTSGTCEQYLSENPKAALEFELERKFSAFETEFSNWTLMPPDASQK